MEENKNISGENEDELRDLAPFLSKIEKIDPYGVPERYFDRLPTIIQERCVEKQQSPLWSHWLQHILNPKVAVAVSMVVVLIFIGIKFFTDEDQYIPLKQIKSEEIAYLIDTNELYSMDIEEYLIIEELIKYDNSKIEGTGEEASEEIIDYLIENDIDLSLIINEYYNDNSAGSNKL